MKNLFLIFLICTFQVVVSNELKPIHGEWKKVDLKIELPKEMSDGRWITIDGYCDLLYRKKTDTVIIRTGIESEKYGVSPGYYSNTSVELNGQTGVAKVLDVFRWGGGSYGNGRLLANFSENPSPAPLHTWDGMAYVEEQDAFYMFLGSSYKMNIKNSATPEAVAQWEKEMKGTWKYSFQTKKWELFENNPKVLVGNKYREHGVHMEYWPEKKCLISLDPSAKYYAECPLNKMQWEIKDLKNEWPGKGSSLDHRSAWDAKRQVWIFRKGSEVVLFSPLKREFISLPEVPTHEKNNCQGITYISHLDLYLVIGVNAKDTWVYHPELKKWSQVKCNELDLLTEEGNKKRSERFYCEYLEKSKLVIISHQLKAYSLYLK